MLVESTTAVRFEGYLRIPEEYQRIQAKSIHESAKILANIPDSQCFDSAPTQKTPSHPRDASSGPYRHDGEDTEHAGCKLTMNLVRAWGNDTK